MEIPQALEGGLRKLDARKRQVSIMKQKISIGSQDFAFYGNITVFWWIRPILSKAGGNPGMRLR